MLLQHSFLSGTQTVRIFSTSCIAQKYQFANFHALHLHAVVTLN